MIRCVIFDLDGTLADTATLTAGRREPWDILKPGLVAPRDWRVAPGVSDLPGQLIAAGYLVAIATRAPKAYASTLVHLIGVDTSHILSATGSGQAKARRLIDFIASKGLLPAEVLYVGDDTEDPHIARAAGVAFADASSLRNGTLLAALPQQARSARQRILHPERTALPFTSGSYRTSVGHVDAAPLSEAVAQSLRDGVPNDQRHWLLLSELFAHPEMSPAARAALCFFTLKVHPGSRARTALQHQLFDGINSSHGRCVVSRNGDLFQLLRELITKHELRQDGALRTRYLYGVHRLFPATHGVIEVDGTRIRIRALQTYGVEFGGILGVTKNYGGAYGTRWRSGQDVRLGDLDFVADITTTGLDPTGSAPLVPIPPTPVTAQQPGEFSFRLAEQVSERSGRRIYPLLQRAGDAMTLAGERPAGPVVLLDDQITNGTSISTAVRLLLEANVPIHGVLAFSATRRFLARAGAEVHTESTSCGFRDISAWLGIPCGCR